MTEHQDIENQRIRDDLQHEIAGREVGRADRFSLDHEHGRSGEEKKERRDAAYRQALTALQKMLAEDPEYAAHYRETNAKLNTYETAAADAHMKAHQDAMSAAAELLVIRAQAGALPDGTRVYRSETGDVFTEEGVKLDDARVADVTWQEDSASWETYQEADRKAEQALRRAEEIEAYRREVLNPARERMEDQDNPVSGEEMDEIQRDVEEQAPEVVSNRLERTVEPETSATVAVPDLRL